MNRIFSLVFILFSCYTLVYAQSPVGTWATVDDETGQSKSHVRIYERNGKLYGVIDKLLIKPTSELCTECKGDKKDKPLLGLNILYNLSKSNEEEWSGGYVLDPKSGKVYKCTIFMESDNVLKLRGYLGFSMLGRTQYWKRVQ